jgi:single-strand DNA-binding protein
MSAFNKVLLLGNLTRDPELRYTPKGVAVVNMGLAVNRSWKTETGETKEEVTFIEITAFGRLAETLAQYSRKGSPLFIEGRLQAQSWDDKQTGAKRSKMIVILESFQFLGSRQDGQAAPRSENTGSRFNPREVAEPRAPGYNAPMGEPPMPGDDDVPF